MEGDGQVSKLTITKVYGERAKTTITVGALV
jgi:hypothetical protein